MTLVNRFPPPSPPPQTPPPPPPPPFPSTSPSARSLTSPIFPLYFPPLHTPHFPFPPSLLSSFTLSTSLPHTQHIFPYFSHQISPHTNFTYTRYAFSSAFTSHPIYTSDIRSLTPPVPYPLHHATHIPISLASVLLPFHTYTQSSSAPFHTHSQLF